jgi:hypothetical protein
VVLDIVLIDEGNLIIYHLAEASERLRDIADLLTNFGVAFLFLAIVDLGFSFLYISKRGRRIHIYCIYAARFLAFALIALALGVFAERESFLTWTYGSIDDASKINAEVSEFKKLDVARKLALAYTITLWALSVLTAVFSTFVFVVSRRETGPREVS